MKEKALILIGLYSRKWLSEQMGLNPITIDRRLKFGDFKKYEASRLNELFEAEKDNL